MQIYQFLTLGKQENLKRSSGKNLKVIEEVKKEQE